MGLSLYRRLSLGLVLIASLCISVDTSAEDNLTVVNERLAGLQGADTPEGKKLRETYQAAQLALKQVQELNQRAQELQAQIANLPKEMNRLNKELAKPVPAESKLAGLERMSLAQLEQNFTLQKAQLLDLQTQYTNLSNDIELKQQKQLTFNEQLSQLKQETDTQAATTSTNARVAEAELLGINAQRARRAAQIRVTELELLVLPTQIEVANLSLQLLARKTEQQNQVLASIQGQIQELRRADAQQTQSNFEQQEVQSLHPWVREALNRNQALSEQLNQSVQNAEAISGQQTKIRQQQQNLTENLRTLQQQVELEVGYAGQEVRRLLQQLPRLHPIQQTREALNSVRLKSLELERRRIEIEAQGPVLARPASTPSHTSQNDETVSVETELAPEQKHQIRTYHTERLTLLRKLQEAQQRLVHEYLQLLALQEQANTQIREASEFLRRHQLWIPSAPLIDLAWVSGVIDGLQRSLNPQTGWQLIQKIPVFAWIVWGMAILIATFIGWRMRQYLKAQRPEWSKRIGKVTQDSYRYTLRLLWSVPIIYLPVLLGTGAGAWLFIEYAQVGTSSGQLMLAMSEGLYSLAILGGLYLSCVYWFKYPDSLAVAHFQWPAPLALQLTKGWRWLAWLAIPMLASLLVIDAYGHLELREGIGRLLQISLLLTLALYWWHLAHQLAKAVPVTTWWQRPALWSRLLAILHFGLGIFTAYGYSYSAWVVLTLVWKIIAILAGVGLIYLLAQRWLLMEERWLAFQRAKTKREEILAQRAQEAATQEGSSTGMKGDAPPPVEENLLDLQTVSEQSRVLLKAGLLGTLLVLIGSVFADFLPSLAALDSIVLWDQRNADGEIIQSITLKGALFGMAVLGLSIFAARNLPGVLELLVLKRMQLAPGSAYAVTTLSKYILVTFGILSCFNQLGMDWGRLQWLVAALGVGLGFGLQEIFANFVSGLIILFEKPVRIGDTITIGNLSGTVTRIQIRATTITDWDRKEIIIPNKAFITEQLVNWSLSDAITRVVIPVGVAYGSNTELARELLLKVAYEHPLVLADPEPNAFFLTFGASSLDMELRVYVNDMGARLPVVHELHTQIAKVFAQHQIEIAFPQLDLHVRHLPDAPAT
ncbi:potassium efflux system protein [Allopseudospirillum japonicum]|uniref:Potassium efflux system protein n=1 Tax=Allopseudospirillum japonicum TaxID=64971 RepID=A0A1H6QX43_9GAMM|nr:mechanosensitive ion channel domain-containing protein [Allopseudospirillum japonicum]SEI46636.1 potassium efflux system protein [Allopseudospirillum japonicum]